MPPPSPQTAPLILALQRLAAGERLGEALVEQAVGVLMTGEATAAQSAGLLMGLRVQGESGEELAGAVRALRRVMRRVELPAMAGPVIDTCGTGGGVVSTFNVSTAAAFVAVGAGARVAKHGNRSYTSRCGSADVLEALGIEVVVEAGAAAAMIARAGMAFLFAPAFHPAMKFVGPVRGELGVPTVMNLIGPLANPAGVRRQVIGVADPDRAPIVATALARLGTEHAMVVHGTAGMDEVSPVGRTDVWEIRGHEITTWSIDPEEFGHSIADLRLLAGGEPGANASRLSALLREPDADPDAKAVVVLNAGAAIYVAGLADSYPEGLRQASVALDDGSAARALDALVRAAGGPASTSG
ncbi:MAG TPA: anthranilate phosphoribosyltransferase [Gemmatimonadales bacterium]